MKEFELKYGSGKVKFSIPEENLLGVIDHNEWKETRSEEEIIKDAIQHPIASARLKELVHPGEKVCIIVSDITRAYQKMSTYLPYLVDEILEGGVKAEDIMFLSSTGTHRAQTEDEHKLLLGEKLYGKYKIVDHDSRDRENLVHLGTTSYGTPIEMNKMALECDHIVLTGAVVYHFLAGYAGGKKSILPGIASYETVTANHSLSFEGSVLGEGVNKNVKPGNIENNPIHFDMLEAASFIRPTFMFNAVLDPKGNIGAAVSGNWVEAHSKGRDIVDKIDGAEISEKADLVIATAGGFPKDINFYQTSKTILNAVEAVKNERSSIIIASECREGLGGDASIERMVIGFDNMLDREKALRDNYTISQHTAYIGCDAADKHDFVMVTELDPEMMKKANIVAVKTMEEALEYVYAKRGKNLKTYIMPHGGSTLPKLVK